MESVILLFTPQDITTLVAMFLTGLSGSFSHCIWMCGPFALAQMSVRMMNTTNIKNEMYRAKSALLLPYYLGKAFTYSIIMTLLYLLSGSFRDSFAFKVITSILLMVALLFFVASIFSKKINLFGGWKYDNFLQKKIDLRATHGIKGFGTGVILGFIPCCFLYSVIITIASTASNIVVANIIIFAFALSTIPALFVAAYIGGQTISYFKKTSKFFYSIVMILNVVLIAKYIAKIWL